MKQRPRKVEMSPKSRRGAMNPFYMLYAGGLALLAVLGMVLSNMGRPPGDDSTGPLLLYCAAGMRAPAFEEGIRTLAR